MIDFADSMIGPPEYDLLGPMLFLAAGDRTLIDAILKGYGWPTGSLSPELRRYLMSLQLLHRYSDFSEQLRIPWMDRVSSLEELEELIWPQ
jgi:hygromycin-B 7''-O-kinase